MKPDSVVSALEDALRTEGVRVRRGRGAFRGGLATVGGQRVIVLNRMHPPEAQLAVLAEALHETGLAEAMYLRPAVRAALEDALAQLDAGLSDQADMDDTEE